MFYSRLSARLQYECGVDCQSRNASRRTDLAAPIPRRKWIAKLVECGGKAKRRPRYGFGQWSVDFLAGALAKAPSPLRSACALYTLPREWLRARYPLVFPPHFLPKI